MDAPAVGERLHEVKAPAADLGRGPVARDGDEADALVDDLDAQLARAVGLDLQAQRAFAAVLDRVGDQLGDEQLDVGETSSATLPDSAFDGTPRGGGRQWDRGVCRR